MNETIVTEERKELKKFNREDVFKACVEYFNGDEMAADVWINKYALKDSSGNIYELTPDDMHKRLAKEFARIEKKYPNPILESEIYKRLKNFNRLIPQGSPMAGIGNNFQVSSLSNCFVIGNNGDFDSYGGILKLDQELVQLMKRRAGVGLDLSFIRPAGSPVKNSALTSTGVVPYMERYSNSTREVAQDGRRGALMESISIAHPDAESFIDAKIDETKVTGANVSVRISDKFMKCAIDNTPFLSQYPVESDNPIFTKEVNAKRIWDKIIHNAWDKAEPGILFWDTIINESIPDCYKNFGFKTISTNPCIVGDTLIAVADGRNAVSILKLVEEGKDVPIYSTNIKSGKVEIKIGRNPRLTQEKAEVWKLTLDDDSFLISTPNHKVLLKNLTYKELKNLQPGDSIFPFYSFNNNGYRQISNVGAKMKGGARRNRRQYRVIHEFYSGNTDAKQFAIHHKDFNSKNDSISNLQILTHEIHHKIHSDLMIGENNPYHKMSQEWKFNFASHPGEKNPKYKNVTNQELLQHGRIVFNRFGKLTNKLWTKYAKENNLPVFLNNDFRFKSFSNFRNQIASNHKVKSIEFVGYENVYNITVDDNNNYHIITSHEDDKFITSSGICIKNCGEITLCADDSCRLLALNLYGYVLNPFTKNSEFDYETFKEDVIIAQRLMDDLIDLELEKIDKILEKIESDPEPETIKSVEKNLWLNIKQKCIDGRRTGLGITAEGDMLAGLNIIYGTDEGNKFVENIHKILKLSAYRSSVILSKERGAFAIYDSKLEEKNPFINRIKEEDVDLYNDMVKYGRRNIALLTIAPTGTVSIMSQTTSGIEPAFLISYTRRVKINPNDENAKNKRVDFVDKVGDCWQNYRVFHHKFKDYLKANGYDFDLVQNMSDDEVNELISKSPYHKATANDVDWVKKVEMQGMVQKHIDHSISVTVNLPNDVTEELVSEVYETGWRSGCKGVTIYRDGSRSGVLISNEKKVEINKIQKTTAPKRPETLPCDIYQVTANGEKWIVLVGIYENDPYEVFAFKPLSEGLHLPVRLKNGFLTKIKKGRYDLQCENGLKIEDLSQHFETTEQEALTRMVSISLRHGTDSKFIVEQLNKSEGTIVSFSKAIARTLKKYIPEDGNSGELCSNCGEKSLVYQEGCMVCLNCSNSKCG